MNDGEKWDTRAEKRTPARGAAEMGADDPKGVQWEPERAQLWTVWTSYPAGWHVATGWDTPYHTAELNVQRVALRR